MVIVEVAPVPLRASKTRISEFAEDVACKLAFATGDPIEPLVVRLGGRIDYKNLSPTGKQYPESIIVRSQKDFTILLPMMTSPERDRFTIAHELGHLILHYPLVSKQAPGATMVATRWVDEGDPDLVRTEWEANWFAAAFLMPNAAFKSIFATGGVGASAMKFNVSYRAAKTRAKSLGMI